MGTAFIVDDHSAFRAGARRLLESEGFEVVGEAADGGAAVELIGSLNPDLVLLDVQLPDTDGFTVSEQLAELADPPVVILISSREASDYGTLVDEAAVAGFISKAELSGEAVRRLAA